MKVSQTAMKYAEKHKMPRQESESYRGVGWDYLLVDADTGDEGEVLDAVFGAELHEEDGELSHLGGEPFYIVGRGDSIDNYCQHSPPPC